MKKSVMMSILLTVFLFGGTYGHAQLLAPSIEASKPQFMVEIDYISNLFGQYYAPLVWKEKTFEFSVEVEAAKAKETVQGCQDIRTCRQAIVNFLNATRDYHVGYGFYSTETAVLPFTVKTFGDKTLVVDVDATKLNPTLYPLEVGDELISMNDKSVADVLKELRANEIENVAETDKALADYSFTNRRGRKNHVVPRGPVLLKWKNKDGKEFSRQLIWDYTPDAFKRQRSLSSAPLKKFQMVRTDLLAEKKSETPEDKPSWGIGERRSFLPDFGVKIWETTAENPFYAYIFQHPKTNQLIGVLRLPSYVPDDYEKAIKAFGEIVTKFEKQTAAMIIDQNSNPGGSVFYLYTLASMLTSQPLYAPHHRMALTHDTVQNAVDLKRELAKITNDKEAIEMVGKTFGGVPMSFQSVVMVREWADFIIREWNDGKKISDPFFLYLDQINPYPEIQFTKPLFVLTNELDFSGGDFFPGILQDNKRATIIGQRTAGAGGYVEQISFPNAFGLQFVSFTGSLAERINAAPLENLGVTPDHLLLVTEEDIRTKFKPYIDGLMKIVDEKMK